MTPISFSCPQSDSWLLRRCRRVIVPGLLLSLLAPWAPLPGQTSVLGPLLQEHNPPAWFQSFTEDRWKASSFAAPSDLHWWQEARLGLFIHFGVSSVEGVSLGWGRQSRIAPDGGKGELPDETYDNLYRRLRMERFDAAAWVAMAKMAGMRYMVVVTKHHDGFHMWDTSLSDYKITKTPFGRDYVKEIVDAAHAAGMPIGLYYSQRDWHHPDYDPRGKIPGRDHKRYIDYQFKAVRELLTKYGKIDILWFDAAYWNGMFTEADWDSEGLYRMARELQPHLLINNRASIPGDFDTPEQHIGAFQTHRPWESCITLTKTWSYRPQSAIKKPKAVIDLLVQSITGDGNLLLNVGPMADGTVQPEEITTLKTVGQWLSEHGEAIYGTRGGPLRNGSWGGTTYRGDTVYVHVLHDQDAPIHLAPIAERVLTARTLGGLDVPFQQSEHGIDVTLPEAARDPFAAVIALKLDRPVSRMYPGSGTRSIFDGGSFGERIDSHATCTASTLSTDADAAPDLSSLFTGSTRGFAFMTMPEIEPWVEVDLGRAYLVKGVRISNRPGPPSLSRIRTLSVQTSLDRTQWTDNWTSKSNESPWEAPLTRVQAGAEIPGVSARHLRLRFEQAKVPLALEKVEVFGSPVVE